MRFGLSETTIHKICRVFNAYPQVEKAILYGSRARGDYRDGSDIDLALQGEALTLDLLFRILTGLDDLDLPYMIDLSMLQDIYEPELLEQIERVGKIFFERAETGSEAAEAS